MGQSHPLFQKENFFQNYRFERTVSDPMFGVLHHFVNPITKHTVQMQQVDQVVDVHSDDVAIIKKNYDYHHPNLIHSFNLMEFADPEEAQSYGMSQIEDSEGTECLLVFENFDDDL